MISDLLSLRDICDEAVDHGNRDLFLSSEVWDGLVEIRLTLEPAFVATKSLQSKNMTLPDIRKVIKLCWLKTAEIGE